MHQSRMLDDMNARIGEIFSSSPAADIEKNLRALLQSFLSRLDLVTREEFDTHVKVLDRTREMLTAMETRLVELERQLSQNH